MRATAALNLRKINRVEGHPLGEVVTAECHRGASVVKPVGFATGNGEASRRRIRTRICVAKPCRTSHCCNSTGSRAFCDTPDRGGMMLIGYARVSTQDQTLQLQHDALTDGGCEKLFREKLSGTRTTLPAREKLLAFARKGDVVVVWKLDRLGRSLRDLIDVVNSLQDRGVGLRSLQEAIDTTTPAGKLTFHIFAALAEFERDMIREPEQILMAETMTADPAISTRQVAEQFGIHRSMLYRHLNARQKRSA